MKEPSAAWVISMVLAVLVVVESVMFVTILSNLESQLHYDVEVHRCRNEELHREFAQKLDIPYHNPEVAPECGPRRP